jgi:hypothetical protein
MSVRRLRSVLLHPKAPLSMLETYSSLGKDTWSPPSCVGHGVHFYSDADDVARGMVEHVRGALGIGQAAMLLSTPKNLLAFDKEVERSGLDYSKAIYEGRLVICNAQRLLERFCQDSMPDERRFRAILGGQLRMLLHRYSGVSIYSEVVMLLMAAGHFDRAMVLEKMWNVLAADRRFDLLCSYPLELFKHDDDALMLNKVIGMHQYTIAPFNEFGPGEQAKPAA